MVGFCLRGEGGAFLAILIYEVFSFMLLSGLFLALHGLGVFVFSCYFIDSKQRSIHRNFFLEKSSLKVASGGRLV